MLSEAEQLTYFFHIMGFNFESFENSFIKVKPRFAWPRRLDAPNITHIISYLCFGILKNTLGKKSYLI
mgnify:CR=1 FL=1